jgi:hypothetical protein
LSRTLDAGKAEELVGIVEALGDAASFRNILREAARVGVFKEHKTLRRYLTLLVKGKVLRMRTRDVGSVNLQQLYTMNSRKPEVWVGLAVFRRYGLNWEIPEAEMRPVLTDFDGLARSRVLDKILMASLEDCLIQELHRDVSRKSGTISFVIAIISTRVLDLPYLLRRADEMHLGTTLRLLFNRILDVVSSRETEVAALVFIAVRAHFLKIARQYSHSGLWKLVEERGVGHLGLRTVSNLSEHEIIMAAGKQLGVTG